jgi:hypothetical protein
MGTGTGTTNEDPRSARVTADAKDNQGGSQSNGARAALLKKWQRNCPGRQTRWTVLTGA